MSDSDSVKIVKHVDYRITRERMEQWLQTISHETGIQCGYWTHKVKGRITRLDIIISEDTSPQDETRVLQTIANHQTEFDQLVQQSRQEAGDTD